MPEFPDANSGGLDTLGAPRCKRPLRKTLRVWAVLLLVCAVAFGMAAGGCIWLRSAFRPGQSWNDRIFALVGSFGLIAPLCVGFWKYLQIKLKMVAPPTRTPRCTVQGGRTRCASNRNSLVAYAIKWASCSAFDPAGKPWQRIAAWIVLVSYTLSVLAVAAFGVICFGAAADSSNTRTATLMMVGMGLLLLVWPAIVARKLIRGLREGKVGTTRDELEALRNQRNAWATREHQKPLSTKIINTVALVFLYGLYWVHATAHHSQHPHEGWITAVVCGPALLYPIWIMFRRPKSAPPTNNEPPATDPTSF